MSNNWDNVYTNNGIYNLIDNLTYDNEVIFGAIMNETVRTNGCRSIFLMVKDEITLSIFIVCGYVKSAKDIIEKNSGKQLDDFALKYLEEIAFWTYIIRELDNIRLSEKEDNDSITLPVVFVDELNTNGFDITYRSAFDADFSKNKNALLGKDKLNSLMIIFDDTNTLSNRGTSVSICCIIVNLTAFFAAIKNVSFIRKIIYSEKLLL